MRGEIWLQLTDAWLTKTCYERYADSVAVQGCVDTQTALLVDPVRPLGPWGDRSDIRAGGWEGDPYPASLHVAWDGAVGTTTPDSLVRVLYAISGAELWLGREGRPYYGTIGSAPDEPISIYNNSAGFVVLLEADDGSRPATDGATAQAPQLLITELGADTTPSGDAAARYRLDGFDGQAPQNVEWYFVPDVVRDNQPIIIASMPNLLGSRTEDLTTPSEDGADWEWFSPPSIKRTMPGVKVGRPRQARPRRRTSGGSSSPMTSASSLTITGPTYTTLLQCVDARECSVPAFTSPGEVVAVATISSGRWSASRRRGESTAPLELVCMDLSTLTLGTVLRGNTVRCSSNNPDVVIQRWRFESDSAGFAAVEETEASPKAGALWQGTLVTSGTVWAHGWRNPASQGQPADSESVHVTAKPRMWEKFEYTEVRDIGQDTLPYPPPALHALGVTRVDTLTPDVTQFGNPVTTGPNTGFAWLIGKPYKKLPIKVAINNLALQVTSTWWMSQSGGLDPTTGQHWCDQSGQYSMPLAELRSQVRKHEGIDPGGTTSHVAVYKEVVKDYDLNALAEGVVQQQHTDSVVNAAQRVYNLVVKKREEYKAFNHVRNKLLVDLGSGNPYNPPCAFRF